MRVIPDEMNASNLATTPCRGLSLSRWTFWEHFWRIPVPKLQRVGESDSVGRIGDKDCPPPGESTAETQPKLQPASWRLSAMISQYFMRGNSAFFSFTP